MSGSRAREAGVTPADGVFLIGPRGIVEDVDEAACGLLGYAREELLGMHGAELVPSEAQPATAVSIDRMHRGEIAHRQGRLTRKDGTVVDVDVSARTAPGGRLTLSLRKR